MNWYIINVANSKENKIKEILEQKVKLFGFESNVSNIIIPKEKVYHMRNGKKVKNEKNYFPGYILLEAKLHGELLQMIKNTEGVIGFLGENGKATPLREDEVKKLLKTIDNLVESRLSTEETYLIGEKVKINEGPFASFMGEIIQLDNDKKRMTLSVNIFNRKTTVELDFLQISK